MKKTVYLLLAAIPVVMIPLTGYTWLIFTVYALLLYFREPAINKYKSIPLPPSIKYFFSLLLFGLLTEIFAIIDNLPVPPEQRILLNPNPWGDLYLALGFYSGFAAVWSVVVPRFKLSHRDIFIIAGAFGIVFEQTGKLLLTLQIFAWPYVFLVYGSFQAIPALLTEPEFRERKELSIIQKTILGAVSELSCFVSAGLLLYAFSLVL